MKKAIATLVLLVIAGPVLAQGYTSMDAVAFLRGADSVQVEVYYSILQKLLPFTHAGNKWSAPVQGKIEIYQNGKIVRTAEIHKEKSFVGTDEDFKQHIADDLLDGAFFSLPVAANTQAVLTLIGLNDTKQSYNDTLKRVIQIPIRKATDYQFSTIELASRLEKTEDKTNFFEKSGFLVMPNPSLTYGGNYGKLYFYTEMNVPASDVSPSNNGVVKIQIFDGSGKEMFTTSEELTLDAAVVPVIGSAEIEGLPTDPYTLQLTLVRNGVGVDTARRIFFYDSGIQLSEEDEAPAAAASDENAIFLNSGIAAYGPLEVEERSAQTLYGANEAQRKEFKKLIELKEKQQWLFNYWRAKDKEEGTAPLAQFRAFLKRVDDANRQFTVMKTPGWKSSRGRVYIQYGKPDLITGEPFAINSKPYIQWEYVSQKIQLQSGSRAQFVFVDKQGGGNFILVSSNARGEVEEDDWFTREAQRTPGN